MASLFAQKRMITYKPPKTPRTPILHDKITEFTKGLLQRTTNYEKKNSRLRTDGCIVIENDMDYPAVIAILRGLTFAALPTVSVNTPAFICAVIVSGSRSSLNANSLW